MATAVLSGENEVVFGSLSAPPQDEELDELTDEQYELVMNLIGQEKNRIGRLKQNVQDLKKEKTVLEERIIVAAAAAGNPDGDGRRDISRNGERALEQERTVEKVTCRDRVLKFLMYLAIIILAILL